MQHGATIRFIFLTHIFLSQEILYLKINCLIYMSFLHNSDVYATRKMDAWGTAETLMKTHKTGRFHRTKVTVEFQGPVSSNIRQETGFSNGGFYDFPKTLFTISVRCLKFEEGGVFFHVVWNLSFAGRVRFNEVRKIYRSILCLREISSFHTVDFEVSGVLVFTPNSLVLIPEVWNSLGISDDGNRFFRNAGNKSPSSTP